MHLSKKLQYTRILESRTMENDLEILLSGTTRCLSNQREFGIMNLDKDTLLEMTFSLGRVITHSTKVNFGHRATVSHAVICLLQCWQNYNCVVSVVARFVHCLYRTYSADDNYPVEYLSLLSECSDTKLITINIILSKLYNREVDYKALLEILQLKMTGTVANVDVVLHTLFIISVEPNSFSASSEGINSVGVNYAFLNCIISFLSTMLLSHQMETLRHIKCVYLWIFNGVSCSSLKGKPANASVGHLQYVLRKLLHGNSNGVFDVLLATFHEVVYVLDIPREASLLAGGTQQDSTSTATVSTHPSTKKKRVTKKMRKERDVGSLEFATTHFALAEAPATAPCVVHRPDSCALPVKRTASGTPTLSGSQQSVILHHWLSALLHLVAPVASDTVPSSSLHLLVIDVVVDTLIFDTGLSPSVARHTDAGLCCMGRDGGGIWTQANKQAASHQYQQKSRYRTIALEFLTQHFLVRFANWMEASSSDSAGASESPSGCAVTIKVLAIVLDVMMLDGTDSVRLHAIRLLLKALPDMMTWAAFVLQREYRNDTMDHAKVEIGSTFLLKEVIKSLLLKLSDRNTKVKQLAIQCFLLFCEPIQLERMSEDCPPDPSAAAAVSGCPTVQPSGQPSRQPSGVPSNEPSGYPSVQLSGHAVVSAVAVVIEGQEDRHNTVFSECDQRGSDIEQEIAQKARSFLNLLDDSDEDGDDESDSDSMTESCIGVPVPPMGARKGSKRYLHDTVEHCASTLHSPSLVLTANDDDDGLLQPHAPVKELTTTSIVLLLFQEREMYEILNHVMKVYNGIMTSDPARASELFRKLVGMYYVKVKTNTVPTMGLKDNDQWIYHIVYTLDIDALMAMQVRQQDSSKPPCSMLQCLLHTLTQVIGDL